MHKLEELLFAVLAPAASIGQVRKGHVAESRRRAVLDASKYFFKVMHLKGHLGGGGGLGDRGLVGVKGLQLKQVVVTRRDNRFLLEALARLGDPAMRKARGDSGSEGAVRSLGVGAGFPTGWGGIYGGGGGGEGLEPPLRSLRVPGGGISVREARGRDVQKFTQVHSARIFIRGCIDSRQGVR